MSCRSLMLNNNILDLCFEPILWICADPSAEACRTSSHFVVSSVKRTASSASLMSVRWILPTTNRCFGTASTVSYQRQLHSRTERERVYNLDKPLMLYSMHPTYQLSANLGRSSSMKIILQYSAVE